MTTGWSTFLYLALLLWDTDVGLEGAVLVICADCTTGEACAGVSGVSSGTAADTAITGSETAAMLAVSASGCSRGCSLISGSEGLDTDDGSSSQTGACAVVGSSHPDDDVTNSGGISVRPEGEDVEGAGSGACGGGTEARAGVSFS